MAVRAFQVVLRRPNAPDSVSVKKRADVQIGDVVTIDGRPWLVVEKEPPLELPGPERIICVPRRVRRLH
jgi:hypothetical protein